MYSPNMLKTFESCPQKYWFKYEEQISVPQKTSYFEKGKKIHALANYYLRGDDITKLEKALVGDECEVWEKLKNNEYEYTLSCKVGEYWVGGRLDAVVKDESGFYILDYKTGSIPKDPEYDFQTMVYLLALNKMKQDEHIKFIYIDLKNNKNCIIEFNNEKMNEYEKRILAICDKIKSFKPKEDIEHLKMCEFCEYKKICF